MSSLSLYYHAYIGASWYIDDADTLATLAALSQAMRLYNSSCLPSREPEGACVGETAPILLPAALRRSKPISDPVFNVLFLCTGNMARSIQARASCASLTRPGSMASSRQPAQGRGQPPCRCSPCRRRLSSRWLPLRKPGRVCRGRRTGDGFCAYLLRQCHWRGMLDLARPAIRCKASP